MQAMSRIVGLVLVLVFTALGTAETAVANCYLVCPQGTWGFFTETMASCCSKFNSSTYCGGQGAGEWKTPQGEWMVCSASPGSGA
jgi:hypothetical protein